MISIIIPVYNGEKYITRCIKQLVNQKSNDTYEILFIDDGSTDSTCLQIHEKQKENSKIKLLHQNHLGVSSARNYGIKSAAGEWIIFCDVDDIVKENFLLDAEECIKSYPDTDIIYYARHYVSPDSKHIREEDISKHEIISVLLTARKDTVLGEDFLLVPVWGKVYRSLFLRENLLQFNEKMFFGEDLLFQLNCTIKTSHIKFIYRGYYKYEQNADSTVHRARKNDTSNTVILQNNIERLSDEYFDEKLKMEAALALFHNWKCTISSDLSALIQENKKIRDCLKRLYTIQRYLEYQRTMDNCKRWKEKLTIKEKLYLITINHFQLIYVLLLFCKKRRWFSQNL